MKEKLKTALFVVLIIIYNLIALSGAVIAGIHQIQLVVEKFGMFISGVHIWSAYDWWLLTLLLFIPEGIYFAIRI